MGKRKRNDPNDLQQKRKVEQNNTEQLEAGIVEYMRLDHFMCHDCLEVKLQHGVNVINGVNGSGKSAILTGLQVGLGAKVTMTNRGKKLVDLIKTGKERARVMLELYNKGRDAFQPEVYGDKIVVIRNISRTASNFLIKSDVGKTIGKSVKDLRVILDHFNIHIDNPMTVMTQDISREFLTNATPAKKFQFFLEATQLYKMVQEYNQSLQSKKLFEAELDSKKQDLMENKQEMEKKQKIYEDALKLRDIGKEIENAQAKLAWAIVQKHENTIEKIKTKIAEITVELEKVQKEMKIHEDKRSVLQKKINENESKLSSENLGLESITQQKVTLNNKIIASTRTNSDANFRIESYKKKISNLHKSIANDKASIQQLKEEAQQDQSDEKQNLLNQIQKSEELISLESQKMADLQNAIAHENQIREQKNAEFYQRKSEMDISGNHLKDLKNQLDNIKRQSKDKLAVFHYKTSDYSRFLNEIQRRQKSFSSMPIGPIGLFFKVQNPEFAGVCEKHLSSNIRAFVVNNMKDRNTLNQIAKSCHVNITIVTYSYTDQPFSRQQLQQKGIPSSSFFTMNDNLVIDLDFYHEKKYPLPANVIEATLRNLLIDNNKIANIILVNNYDEGIHLMFGTKGNKHDPPRGVSSAYEKQGTQFSKRGRTEVAQRNKLQNRLWGANFEQDISAIQRSIFELENSMKSAKANFDVARKELQTIKNSLSKKENQIQSIRRSVNTYQKKIESAHRDLQDLEKESDWEERTVIFQNRIQEYESQITMFQTKIEETISKNKQNLSAHEELLKQVNELKQLAAQKGKVLNQLNREATQLLQAKSLENQELRRLQSTLDERKPLVSVLKDRLGEYTLKLASDTALANELHERISNINESVEDIEREIMTLEEKQKLERERFEGRKFEDIEASFLQSQQQYKNQQVQIKQSLDDFKKIAQSLHDRFMKYRSIRDYYTRKASIWFNRFLNQRGHSGSLTFDTKNKLLTTHVELANQGEQRIKIQDTKSLSGGERSYTTTAFLLALWTVSESPIRCLDEFDIFMDNIHRDIAMKLLMNEAKPERQLILITPHNIDASTRKKHNVIRLKPPRDGTGFRQQEITEFQGE